MDVFFCDLGQHSNIYEINIPFSIPDSYFFKVNQITTDTSFAE